MSNGRKRTALLVPGFPAGTLESALEIIRPRIDDGPGRNLPPWLSLSGREPPTIDPTPPAPGQWAPGWHRFGGGLQQYEGDVELPGDVADYATDPRLSGLQKACLVVAVAQSYDPVPPVLP